MSNVFSDDDLKRFTDFVIDKADDVGALSNVKELKALIARLEAAEKVCNSIIIEMCEVSYDGEALEAWRKVYGK